MAARWTAFGLWAVVAASAVYWGLKLFVPGVPAPAQTLVASAAVTPHGDLSRLLGADSAPEAAAAAPVDSRFHLVGVVAPRSQSAAREGLALIVVGDKPARAFRVGAAVDGDTVLQAVHARGASLGPRGGKTSVALEIPPPAPAATGRLPGPVPGVSAQGLVRPPQPRPVLPLRPLPSPTMRSQQAQPPGDDDQEPGRNNLLPAQ